MKKFKLFESSESNAVAASLSNEAKLALYKKSQKYDISINVLEQVYYRGYSIWNESFGQTPEQFAFDRVNSFVSGGFAAQLDDDLFEGVKDMFGGALDARGISKHLIKNSYEIKRSTGEHTIWHKPSDPKASHVAVPNHRGDFPPGTIRSMHKQFNSRFANEEISVGEPMTSDSSKPSSRFVGSNSLVKILKKATPGQTNESVTGISGIATSNPAKQKPLGLQIKPSLPNMFQQKPQKFGNLPKKPGVDQRFIKNLVQQSEEADVNGVSKGTKERRKLSYVGRMTDKLPNKTLGRESAFKTNVIDEERINTIKKVLNEKQPKIGLKADKTNVVVPKSGATPTIYRPDLNKVSPNGSIVS